MEAKDKSVVKTPAQEQSKSSGRVILRSDNDSVVLKQLVSDDAQRYFDLVDSDRPHLSQHGDRTAKKYQTVKEVQDSIIPPEDHPIKYRFGIWDGDVMVGSDNLTPAGDNRAELGSWVAKGYTGHNYAARARKLLVDFAFNQLKLDEVFCKIVVGNLPSQASVISSGFTFREEKDGEWIYTLSRPQK